MDEFISIHKPLNLDGFSEEKSLPVFDYISPTLEKGQLSESFSYTVGSLVLGSEMKSGIKKILDFCEAQKKLYKSEMSKLLKECRGKPTSPAGSYLTKGLEPFIEDIPSFFHHKEISAVRRASNSSDTCCQEEYNDCARRYIGHCVEAIYAKAMAKQIKDDQTYSLNLRQATQLGIGR